MHHNIHTRALEYFLRRGIHLDAHECERKTDADFQAANPAKETRDNHSTPYYVWRTSGDDRVRASHAVNNGQIFSWDIPPATGHPGEDYNCRCWAEPYDGIDSFVYRTFIKPATDILQNYLGKQAKWGDWHMSLHFYTGNGSGVTLSQIGHLEVIRAYYEANYFGKFTNQIREKAETLPDGPFKAKFEQSYNFEKVLFSYRMSTVHGKFEGEVITLANGTRVIEGNAQIRFIDWFSDPVEMRQIRADISRRLANSFFGDGIPLKENDLTDLFHAYSEVGGHPYPILGNWDMNVRMATPQ